MSNTEVLTWFEKCKLKVGYSGMPRNAQRAFELGFGEGQAPLLSEIERLKIRLVTTGRQFNEAQDKLRDAEFYKNKLQQQLDALKAKVSEHNDACLQGCSKTSGDNHCGYAGYDRDCTTCPKDHMIDLGEHHE